MAWETVLDDELAGAATTTWTTDSFTALAEGELYRWELRALQNAGSTARLYYNSDATAANYEHQRRSEFNASSADVGLPVDFSAYDFHSGYMVRFGGYLFLFSQSIGDQTTHNAKLIAIHNTNTDSVTSFSLVADTASGIAVGTRMVVERCTATPAVDADVTGAATTTFSSGVNAITGPHLLVAAIQHTASATESAAFFNADNADANHRRGGVEGVTSNENNAGLKLDSDADGAVVVVGLLVPSLDGTPVFSGWSGHSGAGVNGRFVSLRNVNESNLDQLDFVCDTADGIAIGSYQKWYSLET